MKVALLGAPGAGKTKIARRITRRLNNESRSWVAIDGYVDRLQERVGRPFGPADLKDNLMVWAERHILESEVAHKGLNSITCGSIYETIIYSAAPSMLIPSIGNEQLMMEETHVAQITMQALGILEHRTFDYDALFYLPSPVPEDETTWSGVVNAKLPEVLEGFFRTAVLLDGTDRQKVDRATDIIRTIASATAVDEEQSIQQGSSASSRSES